MGSERISAAAARRIALAAQGFGGRSVASPMATHLKRIVQKTRLIQMDSVNIAVRAHYLPLFSRLGPYDRTLLERAAWRPAGRRPRQLVEYWAHEAALVPIEDWPLFGWRMRDYRDGRYRHTRDVMRRNRSLAHDVRDVIDGNGPSMPRDIEARLGITRESGRAGSWWDRGEVKHVCEAMFASGELSAVRNEHFSRFYDLAERVVGADAVEQAQQIEATEAHRRLMANAATALGVGTIADLADYYRISTAQARPTVADLVDGGHLTPVTVAGWDEPAYLAADARIPRLITGSTLLSPFDPMVFFRPRALRLFDFHYRIEIYVPAPKRVYGYYVHPYLLDGDIVARVDLKADRAAGVLRVPAAHLEPGRDPHQVAERLAVDLRVTAEWLGLGGVEIEDRGDLAAPLRQMRC